VGTRTFSYVFAPVRALTIILNYPEQKTFDTLVSENQCTAAINGGFYQPGGLPLGWLVTEGKTLSEAIPSVLLNGYLAISDTTRLMDELPGATRYGLQSGPLLLWNGDVLPLRIRNDELARRSVVAITESGETVFLSVFTGDQVFEGPYLGELPVVVAQINEDQFLGITNAMNLDGGSASAFYSPQHRLGELTDVGSVLCAK
jgi:uncharacterized protein YigE (DUF2233 family)